MHAAIHTEKCKKKAGRVMNKDWLNNKTVIVTGASSGIGRGLTTTLIQEHGCTVLGIGRREDRMKEFLGKFFALEAECML